MKEFNHKEYRKSIAEKIKQLRAEGKYEEAQQRLENEKKGFFYEDAQQEHQKDRETLMFLQKFRDLKERARAQGLELNLTGPNGEKIEIEQLGGALEDMGAQEKTEEAREKQTFGKEQEDVKASEEGFKKKGEKIVENVEEAVEEAEKAKGYEVDENGQIIREGFEEDKEKELERIANGENSENEEERESAIGAIAVLEERNKKLKEKHKKGAGWFGRTWTKAKRKFSKILMGAALVGALFFGPKNCERTEAVYDDNQTEQIDSSQTKTATIEKGDGFTQLNEKLTDEAKVYSLSEQFKQAKEEGIDMGVIEDGKEVRLKAISENGEHLVGGIVVKMIEDGKEVTKYFSQEALQRGGYDENGPNDFQHMEASLIVKDGKVVDNIGATYHYESDTYHVTAADFNK